MIRRPPRSTLFPYTTALPISATLATQPEVAAQVREMARRWTVPGLVGALRALRDRPDSARSEEHTSELQSQSNLVCRLLLEKKKTADEANSFSKLYGIL